MTQLRLWGPVRTADTVGRLVKEARVRAGLTQPILATALGVSQATVSRLEADLLIATFDDLMAVAAVLGVGVETLLGSSPVMTRRYRWGGRSPSVAASRQLATALPSSLIVEFVALGGSLRALRAAQDGRQPLSSSQSAILLSLGIDPRP